MRGLGDVIDDAHRRFEREPPSWRERVARRLPDGEAVIMAMMLWCMAMMTVMVTAGTAMMLRQIAIDLGWGW